MDIQGYEPYALDGMERTLAKNPDVALITEFWPYGMRCAGLEAEAYIARLQKFGYAFWEIAEGEAPVYVVPDRLIAEIGPSRRFVDLLCMTESAAQSRLNLSKSRTS